MMTYSWNLIGEVLGEGGEDQSGQNVAFNSNGDRIITSAPYHIVQGEKKGHARVVQQGEEGEWAMVSSDIDGIGIGDRVWSVAMNEDGDRIAVGAPYNDIGGSNAGQVRIFRESNGAWVLVGEAIFGSAVWDLSGMSIDMDGNGTRVIIGSPSHTNEAGSKAGQARIYDEVDGSWVQVGNSLEGSSANDEFGTSVSISTDGKHIIVGSPYNDDNGTDSGHVKIYKEVNGSWVQIGADIQGESPNDWAGYSVDISSSGQRVVIGSPYNSNMESGGFYSGQVRVYEQFDGSWMQIGQSINGEKPDDWSGYSVAMSSNGQRVVIGAPYNHDNGYHSGHARVFEEVDNVWIRLGQDLDGNSYEGSGASVDINSDGTRILVGAPENTSDNYSGAGHVRVYELGVLSSSPMPWWGYFSIFTALLIVLSGLFFFWKKRNGSGGGSKMNMNGSPVKFPIPVRAPDADKDIETKLSSSDSK